VPEKISNIITQIRYPVADEKPVTSYTGTGYTATVAWKDADDTALAANASFVFGTVYTATITLTKANAAYTFAGIEADSFKVAGVDATNTAGTANATTMVVTVTFSDGALSAIRERE